MAAEDDLVAVRAAFDLQRSLVGNSGLTDESFKSCQKTSQALFGDIMDAIHPWAAKTAESRKNGQVDSLLETYKRLVGDPDDPEFQKKLLHDLEQYEKSLEPKAAVEPEDDRINRLLKERDEHYKRVREGGRP